MRREHEKSRVPGRREAAWHGQKIAENLKSLKHGVLGGEGLAMSGKGEVGLRHADAVFRSLAFVLDGCHWRALKLESKHLN